METIINQTFPSKGEMVIRVGNMLTITWQNRDLSDVNIYLMRGSEKILLSKQTVVDGINKYSTMVTSLFFTETYDECYIRIEQQQDDRVWEDSGKFKVLRKQ